MDPITIASVLVLAGLIGAAADVATDGLVRAELFGGGRGAGGYAVRQGRERWDLARTQARTIRERTPQGRRVQGILDQAGVFARAAGSEIRALVSGLAQGWRSGRKAAHAARSARRGNAPLPIVRVCGAAAGGVRSGVDRLRSGRGARDASGRFGANGDAPFGSCVWTVSPFALALFGYEKPCGAPVVMGSLCATHADEIGRTPCLRCGQMLGSNPDCEECSALRIARGEVDPYGPTVVCDDFTTDPNGGLNDPMPTDPPATGDRDPHAFDCGCCGMYHGRPLEPGEHCDWCTAHDHTPAPAATSPATGPTPTGEHRMADINSAPAAIAAWEAIGDRWESLQSRTDALHGELDSLKNEADALHGEVATLADSMGDFATGGEADVAASVGQVTDALTSAREQATAAAEGLTTAKERTDGYVTALHVEFDPSIEAAAGKNADVHTVMQEV